jgi:hypothetical protein
MCLTTWFRRLAGAEEDEDEEAIDSEWISCRVGSGAVRVVRGEGVAAGWMQHSVVLVCKQSGT